MVRISLFQSNRKCQYRDIFESLTVIGWFFKDLYPVSLYMYEERGEAEDFFKLWHSIAEHVASFIV